MNDPKTAIRQIIPATGWNAVFVRPKRDNGRLTFTLEAEPVVAWALVDDESGEYATESFPYSNSGVVGLRAEEGSWITTYNEQNYGLIGFAGPGEDMWEVFGKASDRWLQEQWEKNPGHIKAILGEK